MTIYRTNSYRSSVFEFSKWDKISIKLVGHPNLFTNLLTSFTIFFIPLAAIAVALIMYIYSLYWFCK